MRVKLIDFGGKAPERAHFNDAGADVFAAERVVLWPGVITKVPLGIGLELPDGFVAFVLPRSGMSVNKGITTEMVPIDSGYRGQIHAIMFNATDTHYTINIGDKIAQLVVMPVILADYNYGEQQKRGISAFGSTGEK